MYRLTSSANSPATNNSPVGFQFGLYHVVAPISSSRSISLASLFVTFYFWLIRSFTDPTFTGTIFVCGPLHHYVLFLNKRKLIHINKWWWRSNVFNIGLHWSKQKAKQEFTAKEVAKVSGPALGKEAKQYWTMPWIIASQGLEKGDEIIANNAMKLS